MKVTTIMLGKPLFSRLPYRLVSPPLGPRKPGARVSGCGRAMAHKSLSAPTFLEA